MGNLFAKNRKQLIEAFRAVLGPAKNADGTSNTLFTFEQGKKALDAWMYQNFKWDLTKAGEAQEKLKCLFRTVQVHSQA